MPVDFDGLAYDMCADHEALYGSLVSTFVAVSPWVEECQKAQPEQLNIWLLQIQELDLQIVSRKTSRLSKT